MKTKRLGARWLSLGLAVSVIAMACGRSSGGSPVNDGGGTECKTAKDCSPEQSCIDGSCVQSTGSEGGGEGQLPGQAGAPPDAGSGGRPAPAEGGASAGGAAPTYGGEADAGAPPVDPCLSCSLTQTCVAGTCLDIVCTPGGLSCVDGDVWACSPNGTARTLRADCGEGQFCAQEGESAECSPTQCTPGAAVCNGGMATTCRADGSAPQPGGTDCSASGEVCYGGQCLTQGCKPGEKLCQHDDVHLCSQNGTATVLFETCAGDEICDPDLAQCRRRLCTPGLLGCDSNRVARCNALGVGWEQTGTDCASSNSLCVDGSCKPKVCTPSTTFCADSGIYTCDALGIQKTLQQQCGDAYYCASAYSGYVYCAYDVCQANAPVCNGNALTTCASDGSGMLPGGTPCPNGQGCSNGACKTTVCEPNQPFCRGNTPAYCAANGVDWSSYSPCADDTTCKLIPNYGVTCAAHNCEPGKQTCLGNQAGKCDDGFVLASVSSDCVATQQVCDPNLKCADTAVDTLGGTSDIKSFAAGEVAGNVIKVLSNRTLTQIEADLVLAASRTLTWVVLERIGDGYFTEVFAKDVTGQSGSGYFSSGALTFQLQAGKTYALGVRTPAGSIAAYRNGAPWPIQVSLGKVLGGFAGYYIDASALNDERITTAP